jgi:hypothetical protein
MLWTSKLLKKSWNEVIPRKHISQQTNKRIADSVWLSLYMRDNEYVQHPSSFLIYILNTMTVAFFIYFPVVGRENDSKCHIIVVLSWWNNRRYTSVSIIQRTIVSSIVNSSFDPGNGHRIYLFYSVFDKLKRPNYAI